MKVYTKLFTSIGVLLLAVLLFAVLPVETAMAQSTLYVDDDFTSATPGWGTTHFATIQSAIGAAIADDTIEVAAGEYVEVGQIVIDKNLTIIGEDKASTIIKPGQDTGSSGDARGWFLVQSGVTFNLSHVTLDGQGWKVYQGIRSLGEGTIDNVSFKNMVYSQYLGFGVVVMDANMTFSNNTFSNIGRLGMMFFGSGVTDGAASNNTYTGKGEGDWLDYAVEVGAGAHATISGNTFTDCLGVASSDGSNSAGILVSDYYGPGTTATITDNTLSSNTMGIGIGYLETDASVVTATGNTFADNPYHVSAQNSTNIHISDTVANNTFDQYVTASSEYTIYSSIQEAIDDATAGDTILVGPGTYLEDLEIGKSISIQGPNDTISPDDQARNPEAILKPQGGDHAFLSTANDIEVTVKGLMIDMGDAGEGDRFVEIINKTGNTWDFEKNIFANAAYSVNGNWYITGAVDPFELTLKDNYFYGSEVSNGIALWGDLHTIHVSDNIWEDNGGWAMNFNHVQGEIANNVIMNTTITGPEWYDDQAGIILASDNNDVSLTANTFELLSASAVNIYDSFAGSLAAHNNLFTNIDFAAVKVRNDGNDADLSGVEFADNAFDGNLAAFENNSVNMLNASGNWFGTAMSAEVAPLVSGSVDYSPWLASGTDTSTDPGFQGDFSTLWVDDDSPQAGMDGHIQEAVNLVTDSTIYVAEGTYVEEILIDKPVHIIGQGASTIIQSPDTITQLFGSSSYPIILIKGTEDVTIENLVVDGAGKGNANYRFVGVAFENAGGLLTGLTLTGIRDTPFSGAQHGVAVYAYNSDGVAHEISLQDNTFVDFQKNAIALNANETTPLMINVQGNTITGAGATDVTAQNGIQIWAADADGVIANNTISGIGYSGSGWVGSSILLYGTAYGDVLVDNNVISGAQMGVYLYDGSATIRNNTVNVQEIGDFSYGIIASDPPSAKPEPFGEENMTLAADTARVGATLPVRILDNEINLVKSDKTEVNSTETPTWGILAEGGWTKFNLDLTITRNLIDGFDYGIEIFQTDADTGEILSVSAHFNCITNSQVYGMLSNAEGITVDAVDNFWGDPSGPYHPEENPDGLGGEVSDGIEFDPWRLFCPLKKVTLQYYFPTFLNE